VRIGSLDAHLNDSWSAMLSIARVDPSAAPVLAAAVLERLAQLPGERPLEESGVGRHQEVAVAELGGSASEQYVRHLVPVIVELATRAVRPDWRDDGLVADRIWHMRYSNTRYGLKDNLLLGAQRAMEHLSMAEPAAARRTIESLRSSQLEVAAILCVHGFIGNPQEFANEAAEWLRATPGALTLGYSDSHSWLSRQLIAAISPQLSEEGREALEATVRGFTTPWERTRKGLRSRGYTELTLLNGFGWDLLSEVSQRRLAELRRKFLIHDVPVPQGITGGAVPAPISTERAGLMSDRQWIRAMQRHSTEGIRWRDGRLVGDSSSQAQVLDDLTGKDPERFGRLYLRLDESIALAYRAAILRGLARCEVPTDLLSQVLVRTAELGDIRISRAVVQLIEAQGRYELPSVALDLLSWIAEVDPDPVDDVWDEPEDDELLSFNSIESAGLNSARGEVARAVGVLVNNFPSRLPHLRRLLDRLVQDSTQQVRSATAHSLASVLFVDAEGAIDWFLSLLTGSSDGLLGSTDVEFFIHYAVRLGYLAEVMPVLDRLASSASPRAHRHRARQLTVGSIGDETLDQLVDRCMTGTESERTGVLDVAVQNLAGELRRGRLINLIKLGLNDPVLDVRESAARAFHQMDDLNADEGRALFAAAAAVEDFDTICESALLALETYRLPLPEAALQLCERFVAKYSRDIGDIATGAAGTAMYVVRVAIRFHAQQSEPALRSRCLDVIDVLAASRAHGVEEGLEAIER
jgi:hypothetical protein